MSTVLAKSIKTFEEARAQEIRDVKY